MSVLSNRDGYSLVEMLISMAILAIVAVALMQSSLIVIQKNLQNELRDEAVRIAEQRMSEIRSGPGGFENANLDGSHVDLVVEDVSLPDIVRPVRSGTVTYRIQKNVASLDSSTKQVTVTVTWPFKGRTYSHVITSIVRK